MPTTLLYNTSTGKLCGNEQTQELDACCVISCDPCQMQMDLSVNGFGMADELPFLFCTESNGNFRLRPTDTPTFPPAPPEACTHEPITDFICFLESDPFEITDITTEAFRWAVRIAQHVNGEDWVVTAAWYNVDGLTAFWWTGTVEGTGNLAELEFCFGDIHQCANLGGFCSPEGTVVCGTAIETELSRCDFQCPEDFQLTPDGIADVTCIDCTDLNEQSYAVVVVQDPIIELCDFDGVCHWGATFIIEGAGAGCPDTIELGVSIQPAFANGDGPPWHVFAFLRVRIDAVWHHVAWLRRDVTDVCCELDIHFTVEEICDVSEAGECDLTQATLHLLAGDLVS